MKDQTVSKTSRSIRPGCDCTEREVLNTTMQADTGIDGRKYTHIIRRPVRCKACGQLRIDWERETLKGRPCWPKGSGDAA